MKVVQERFALPTGGLNFQANTMTMGPDDAYVLDNLIARTQGLELRKGWQYWVPQASSFTVPVRTIMPFIAQSSADSKLFAGVADNKVYDITALDTIPVLSLTPSTPADISGEWYFTNYVAAYATNLCMVAAGAGYYRYNKATGWKEILIGNGTDGNSVTFPVGDTTTTKDFAFCWVFKNRLWFIRKQSAVCYFLPTGQTAGVLAMWDFGPQLIHGGSLAWAANWTYDSGQGIDDSLILASDSGDVLIYQGTDPVNATTFSLKGVWFIGRLPAGRRGFGQYGGDVFAVTEYGVTRISDLVAGKTHTTEMMGTIGQKINPFLAQAVSGTIGQTYWYITPYPTEELIFVGSPNITADGDLQSYSMNSLNGSWNTISKITPLCAATFYGKMIAGNRDGSVIQCFVGYKDGDTPGGSGAGSDITGRMIGSFLEYGSPVANKRMLRVRLYGLADGRPIWAAKFLAEYDIYSVLNVYGLVPVSSYVWDVARWDQALWQAGKTTFKQWYGTSCFGKKVALQLAISGTGATLATDYEAAFESGLGL
jgi:hypothetical protein